MSRKRFGLSLIMSVLTAALAVVVAPAAAQAAVSIPSQRIKVAHSNLCLSANGESNATVTQSTCPTFTPSFSDKLTVVPKAAGYQIQSRRQINPVTLCLTVPGSSTANSVKVTQATCSDTAKNNLWTFAEVEGRTTFRIKSAGSGKCLTVPGSSTAAGVELVQYTCGTTATQANDQFYWPPATSATITALPTEANTRVMAAQGAAATGAVLGPLVVSFVNNFGLLSRGFIADPDVTGGVLWTPGEATTRYTGHPTVDKQADGRIVVTARNATDGDLDFSRQTTKGTDGFGAYTDLGGSGSGQLATGRYPDGKLETYAVNNGYLYSLYSDGTYLPYGAWSGGPRTGTTPLPGAVTPVGEPAVITAPGGVRIFVRNSAGQVETILRSTDEGGSANLGGSGITGTPSAVNGIGNAAAVAVRDAEGHILVKRQQLDGSFPAAWTQVGDFVAAGSPAIALDPSTGGLGIVARGADNRIYYVGESAAVPGTWGEWFSPLPTEVTTDPSVFYYTNSRGPTWGYLVRDAVSVYLVNQTSVASTARAATSAAPHFTSRTIPIPAAAR
ncbi:RICIN domain-containing protein [Symbioplanes lichenis]|uniref:RICIN domain-containing protein n=1 Tax=Symbioplanes lichenis TaxID=1629072 RepID=UPI002739545A|nr:RICIN domain-containing protein [Actinoplanes lichenis]